MHNAFTVCFAEGFRSVVLIGSDSPDLPREIINEAFESLKVVTPLSGQRMTADII